MNTAALGIPTLEINGPVARIRLNRPRQHNRFEAVDIAALARMVAEVENERTVRVLLVGATGPTFSAGFDIGALGDADAPADVMAFGRLCDQLEGVRIPTVCALNGSVYGGATDFALACDYRIGVRGARMRMPPTRLGIPYFHGGLRRYVEQLGLSTAKRLLLSAEEIDGDTMLRVGFLHQLVDAAELTERADAMAMGIAAGAPSAVQGLKASLTGIRRGTADPAETEARFVHAIGSEDLQEGLRAWKERRQPCFADR
ncbi:enoyl-CoA hydratase/isomerase family protein [Enterovirga aerilata]|uniref:Enoyl-CoA hydratase/isomerase family protein n=1 Tax=Enterovirga aerilata TaxID=2730920 RepID=A0A849IDR0_9HYPH|nr:enoyl-CoA hydratase/isomerase family protein [Enterovirga sp. DB1703]NNM74170.1 enoyl-CoA hydratase/isomerase family protein [Enterovirga sp. DB1703]